MKIKTRTPYQRLLEAFRNYFWLCENRKRVLMGTYSMDALKDTYRLRAIWERTTAARQLGYDVVLTATDKGLEVYYIESVPPCPDIIRERDASAAQ